MGNASHGFEIDHALQERNGFRTPSAIDTVLVQSMIPQMMMRRLLEKKDFVLTAPF